MDTVTGKIIPAAEMDKIENLDPSLWVGRRSYLPGMLRAEIVKEGGSPVLAGDPREMMTHVPEGSVLGSSSLDLRVVYKAKKGVDEYRELLAEILGQNAAHRNMILTNNLIVNPSDTDTCDRLDAKLRRAVDRWRDRDLRNYWMFLSFIEPNADPEMISARSYAFVRKLLLPRADDVHKSAELVYENNPGMEADVKIFFSMLSGLHPGQVNNRLLWDETGTPVSRNRVVSSGELGNVNRVYFETTDERHRYPFCFRITGEKYEGIGLAFETGLKTNPLLRTRTQRPVFYR